MIPKVVNIVSGNGIRGYGDTVWMLVTQIFGIIFVVIGAFLGLQVFGWGMFGLYMVLLADEIIRGTANTLRFYRGETSLFHKGLDKV
jgi:Na+-driven multidrug efflux pump